MNATAETSACPKARSDLLSGSLDAVLSREFLLTNGLGSYASSTVIGVHTRKYHGLYVRATQPPVRRCVLLNNILARCWVDNDCLEIGNFEFGNTIHPNGYVHLVSVWRQNEPKLQVWNTLHVTNKFELLTTYSMFEGVDVLRMDFRLRLFAGYHAKRLAVDVLPFCSLRDFHNLRRKPMESPFQSKFSTMGVCITDKWNPALVLCLKGDNAAFVSQEDWWFNFRYREEIARGHEGFEEQYVPGYFHAEGSGNSNGSLSFTILAGPSSEVLAAAQTYRPKIEEIGPEVVPPVNLEQSAQQFIVQRPFSDTTGTSVIAGYHWFTDWGRDSFVSLPGLFLETGRFAEAKSLLETFARVQKDGLIPNYFDDQGEGAAYNSVDAGLWYAVAADKYSETSGDASVWSGPIGGAVRSMIEAYNKGTPKDIFVDRDGLLSAGSAQNQLTWMDAKYGSTVFTPRHGKAVSVNALWFQVLSRAAIRFANLDWSFASLCQRMAAMVREGFEAFWYEEGGYCYDVIQDGKPDASIRPNMLIACLSDDLLSAARAKRLLAVVRQHLVTPMGLRTLSPSDPRYCGRYVGNMHSRDSAYHQGTVWAWWVGPYVEAVLKFEGHLQERRSHCLGLVKSLQEHARLQAGIGSVSEIFDGDPPYTPRGCIAQAWSVAELLRAEKLLGRPTEQNTPLSQD